MDTQGKAQPDEREVLTSIRLTRGEHEALQQIASREHRSMSAQIRAWIDAHREAA